MTTGKKLLFLEVGFFVGFPLLGWLLIATLGTFGAFLHFFLLVSWCWALFAFFQYRFCRQEEILNVLHTAASMQAPVESVLQAYLKDRPQDGLYRFWVGMLLCFIFPGYYWIHRRRRFDFRVKILVKLVEAGVPLDQALAEVPGVVSREIALAVTVGQFTGKLAHALHHLPGRRLGPLWGELTARLLYPMMLLLVMAGNAVFVAVFIIPKFEKIFSDFRLKLPPTTSVFMEVSRWVVKFGWALPLLSLLALVLINLLILSSRAKWYFPVVGRLYRLNARGQFLQILGLMLETGKPLPQILDCTLESRLLPRELEHRVDELATDLEQGQPLAEGLARRGLITQSMSALIVAAEKANNLPWALQELGEALVQRCARLTYRVTMVVFPLTIFAVSGLIGLFAVSVFAPLVSMMRGIGG
jgi:type II secretory pathway component PulF